MRALRFILAFVDLLLAPAVLLFFACRARRTKNSGIHGGIFYSFAMNISPLILIGGGNMGGAMARRWQAAGLGPVHVVEPDAARRSELAASGLTAHEFLEDAPLSDIYVLAIKPQQFAASHATLTHEISDRESLLISIMAGVPLHELRTITPNAVRVMPNLPALIGESMSVACAPGLDEHRKAQVQHLLSLIGAVAWVEKEHDLHAVTAISGSGPAYVFAFMEALQQAAIAHGLPAELARQLVNQTLRGATHLAEQSVEEVATLRAQVTSKGGTTEAALKSFTHDHFAEAIGRAVTAALHRSVALSEK